MITSAFLTIIFALVDFVTGWLPVAVLPVPLSEVLASLQTGINQLGTVIPIIHILAVFSAFIALEGSILLYKLANELYNKIRGSGS